MKKSIYRLVIAAGIAVTSGSLEVQTVAQVMAFEQQGNLEEAAQVWKAITERNPPDGKAFASFEIVLLRQQKYGEAWVSKATTANRSFRKDVECSASFELHVMADNN